MAPAVSCLSLGVGRLLEVAESCSCGADSLHFLRRLSAALRLRRGDDLGVEVRRHFLVVIELHVVRAAAAGRRREVLLVGEHLLHRHLGADDRRRAARVHAADAAAAAVEIAHQVAGEVARRVDLDVHDRLEQRRAGARHAVLEGERAGHLERHFARVDRVERAVEDAGAEVDHRVAGEEAAHPRVLDPLLDRRHELARDRAAEDVVDELEVAAARQRLELHLAVAELAVAAGLLLVAAVRLDRRP